MVGWAVRIGYDRAMGKAEWGVDPEFFGPRHAHREGRIVSRLQRLAPETGLHIECAAGVGSLSVTLARQGATVVACDRSLRSLAVLRSRTAADVSARGIFPVLADITQLPFTDRAFASATSAETLEHIEDHEGAANELARVLAPGGVLVGTVPAGPLQWSEWDEWAGHLRRYTRHEMLRVLESAGLEAGATVWGWPLLRSYDAQFLKRVNRRRLQSDEGVDDDPALSVVSALGRRPLLVRIVRALFAVDRLFDGAPWGVGLLFWGRKPAV